MVKKFRKTQDQFPAQQRFRMEQRQMREVEPAVYKALSKAARENCARLLRAFAAYSDTARIGVGAPELIALQQTRYWLFRESGVGVEPTECVRAELQVAEQARAKPAPKPMPQKWVRRAQRGQRAGKHQGQVADRTEVSHVVREVPRRKQGKRRW